MLKSILTSLMTRSAIILLLCSLSLSAHAIADNAVKRPINIPPQNLATALEQLSHQSGTDLVYRPEQVRAYRTKGLAGEFFVEEAARKLLEGTPLTLTTDKSGALLIAAPLTSGSSTNSGSGPQTPSSPGDSLQLAQATPGGNQAPSTVANSQQTTDQSTQASGQSVEPYPPHIAEILIQGSRIMNVDVKRTENDAQPYYIFDSKQIEQSGAVTVEDFLKQQLTMNTTIQSYSQSVSTLGATSSINLRGLGANETLILIDGRRSAGATWIGNKYQADLNSIPLAAIERIEVLPSSASAIYGGAAIGGVVNIILKKNFQGGDFGYTFENTTNASAPMHTVSATYGLSLEGGKTRIMLAGNYSDSTFLLTQDRLNLVGRGITTILQNSPSYLYNPFNPFPGASPNITCQDPNGNPTNCILKNGTALNSPITHVSVGAAPGSDLSAGLLSNAGTYNLNLAPGAGQYGLQSPIGAAPLEKSLMATLRREFTDTLEVFTEFSTRSNASRSLLNFLSFAPSFVPSSAPDNPFQQDVLVTIPTTLAPPQATDNVTQSATVGLLAHLTASWNSELDYTWSRNSLEVKEYFADNSALNSALAAGTLNPFADTIAYPLNLSPYLAPTTWSANSTLNDLGLRVSGPIGSLPWGSPMLTIGLEHRKEGTHDGDFYTIYPLNPANNFHAVYFGQSQSTNSIYAEAQVPLVTEKNAMPLVRSLELQVAGRSENYTVNAGTAFEYVTPAFFTPFSPPQGVHTTIDYTSTNPTIGLKYQPVEDLTFRASYAKAFLPPTAAQFLPNPAPTTYTAPITDPQNGQTYPVHLIVGGNPNLKPQTSKDWDLGVIFEPQEQLLKGLRVNLQYYRITQPNYITTPIPQLIVSNPVYASRVTRDPTTGRITLVDISYVNALEYKTNGWDFTIDYRKPTAFGIFDLHALGTVINRDQRQYTIGGRFLNFVGYPSEGGEAQLKANATLSWEYRQWKLGWTATYYGSYQQAGAPGDPVDPNDPFFTQAQGSYTIPSQIYHEIFASYVFNQTAPGQSSGLAHNFFSNLTLQVGVKNLFNTLPPFDAYYQPYFYSPYGDPRLRDYRIALSKAF